MVRAIQRPWSRRSFLKWSIIMAAALQVPFEALAKIPAKVPEYPTDERKLSLYNIHTGEYFYDIYWADGAYLGESLEAINRFMRDHRTDEIKEIDIRLLDLVHAIQTSIGGQEPFQVISGYRSHKTNDLLIKQGRQVARNSFHIKGKAVDIYQPCISLGKLRKLAMKSKVGGVGYYPRHHFIHVDTGPVRYW
jgi:uncharacterized protein YcbK (DUF882 family)